MSIRITAYGFRSSMAGFGLAIVALAVGPLRADERTRPLTEPGVTWAASTAVTETAVYGLELLVRVTLKCTARVGADVDSRFPRPGIGAMPYRFFRVALTDGAGNDVAPRAYLEEYVRPTAPRPVRFPSGESLVCYKYLTGNFRLPDPSRGASRADRYVVQVTCYIPEMADGRWREDTVAAAPDSFFLTSPPPEMADADSAYREAMGALGLPWSSRGTERPEALAELRRIVAEHPKTEYAAAAALGLVIESECDVARGDLAATDFVREWTTIGSALAEDHIAPWLGHHAMRVLGGRPMDQAALLRGWMKSSPGTYLASAARQLAKQCGVTLMGER